MQRRYTGIVQGVEIRADRHEICDRLGLCRRVPVIGVRRVVKGFGATAILRPAIRPVRDEELRDRAAKSCGGHMKGRIAGVK